MAPLFSSAFYFLILFTIKIYFVVANGATPVEECPDEVVHGEVLNVTVSDCNTPLCFIQKSTDPSVKMRFRPKNAVHSLSHLVSAKMFCIFGNCVWKRYDGVDGTPAEDNIFLDDSKTPATFPLEPGKEYIYDNSFHVESYYPSIMTTVYWALKDSDDIVTCFLMNVKIVS